MARQNADVIARIVSTIPVGRIGTSEEIAKAALFLASDDASFVAGIELFVNGGRALRIRSSSMFTTDVRI